MLRLTRMIFKNMVSVYQLFITKGEKRRLQKIFHKNEKKNIKEDRGVQRKHIS